MLGTVEFLVGARIPRPLGSSNVFLDIGLSPIRQKNHELRASRAVPTGLSRVGEVTEFGIAGAIDFWWSGGDDLWLVVDHRARIEHIVHLLSKGVNNEP
jgi:hypothetical protein